MFYLLPILILAVFFKFILVGREYGYQAIAKRTSVLNKLGIKSVYLASSLSSVGLRFRASIWDLLNTGYLIYLQDENITIEFPWWNKMQILETISLTKVDLVKLRDGHVSLWNKSKRITLGRRRFRYVLRSVNKVEVADVKLSLRKKPMNMSQAYIDQLIEEIIKGTK